MIVEFQNKSIDIIVLENMHSLPDLDCIASIIMLCKCALFKVIMM